MILKNGQASKQLIKDKFGLIFFKVCNTYRYKM